MDGPIINGFLNRYLLKKNEHSRNSKGKKDEKQFNHRLLSYCKKQVIITKQFIMLRWTIAFVVIALIAGVLGFGGIAGAAAGIAKILFYIFIVLFLFSLISGLMKKA